jgi:hypothetical protein
MWNWSFLPLDLVLSISGLVALRLFKLRVAAWYELSIVSAALTFAAGFMAISYWSLARDFAWSWWVPNGLLALWPVAYLVRLKGRPSKIEP